LPRRARERHRHAGDDGYALVEQVRQRPDLGDLPAIALTAYTSSDDRARMLAAGFQLHVAKPAEPGELTAAIAAVAVRGVKRSGTTG
jgi:CheY-like chemotaxis protein